MQVGQSMIVPPAAGSGKPGEQRTWDVDPSGVIGSLPLQDMKIISLLIGVRLLPPTATGGGGVRLPCLSHTHRARGEQCSAASLPPSGFFPSGLHTPPASYKLQKLHDSLTR